MGPNNDFCKYDNNFQLKLEDIERLFEPEEKDIYLTPQTKMGTGIQDSNNPDKVIFDYDSDRMFQ